jgi:hypothetical protein
LKNFKADSRPVTLRYLKDIDIARNRNGRPAFVCIEGALK